MPGFLKCFRINLFRFSDKTRVGKSTDKVMKSTDKIIEGADKVRKILRRKVEAGMLKKGEKLRGSYYKSK